MFHGQVHVATATEIGPRACQGRRKRGIGAMKTPNIVLWSQLIAIDRLVTAFVLSMFKTNAKVRRSGLERVENVLEFRRS